jgi:hypothetical protein
LHLDFSSVSRAAFGRRQIEMRWRITHEISGDCYEARARKLGRRI